MEDKKSLEEIIQETEALKAQAAADLKAGKRDLEEIVEEAEEKAEALRREVEENARRQQAQIEELHKKTQENPHGLIRSTVEKNPEIVSDESMDDYLAELEASFVKPSVGDVMEDDQTWERLTAMRDEKTVIEGEITEVVKAGAIMMVDGIRGFIPASKLALDYVDNTEEYLNKTVRVQILDVDKETEKLVLSAKELLQEAAIEAKNEKISRLTAGNIVEGTVASLKDYGAFVDIGDGIQGLLHISQISNVRITNIRKVLKEGQSVRVLITKVENGKISLSMKALDAALNTEKTEEEEQEYSDGQQASTSLFDLLKGFKL